MILRREIYYLDIKANKVSIFYWVKIRGTTNRFLQGFDWKV